MYHQMEVLCCIVEWNAYTIRQKRSGGREEIERNDDYEEVVHGQRGGSGLGDSFHDPGSSQKETQNHIWEIPGSSSLPDRRVQEIIVPQ